MTDKKHKLNALRSIMHGAGGDEKKKKRGKGSALMVLIGMGKAKKDKGAKC